jgi:hypothetical protein
MTKIVPLSFKTIGMIADKLVENGVTVPVRCKGCKHWKNCGKGCGYCKAWDGMRYHNNYCNYGERKK